MAAIKICARILLLSTECRSRRFRGRSHNKILIDDLVAQVEKKALSLKEVKDHAAFWKPEQQVRFLRSFCNEIMLKEERIQNKLDRYDNEVFFNGAGFKYYFGDTMLKVIKMKTGGHMVKNENLRGLLKLIRNIDQHFPSFKCEQYQSIQDFCKHVLEAFTHLLLALYEFNIHYQIVQ